MNVERCCRGRRRRLRRLVRDIRREGAVSKTRDAAINDAPTSALANNSLANSLWQPLFAHPKTKFAQTKVATTPTTHHSAFAELMSTTRPNVGSNFFSRER